MQLAQKKFNNPLFYTALCFIYISIFIIPNIFFSFNIALYIFALGFASLFILKIPEVGLYTIILCTMIYERYFTLQPIIWDMNIYKIYPIDVLITITFISIIIHYFIKNKKTKFNFTHLEISALIFFAATIIGLIYSLIINFDKTLIFATFKNYSYLLILFLTIFTIKTKKQFKNIINIFLAGGIFLILFIFYGLLSGNGLWSEFTPGTRFLAQTHTYFLLLPVFLTIVYLSYGQNIFGKIKTKLILLIQTTGIIAGLHRHLWLSFLAGLTTIFILLNKARRKKFLKNILIIIFIALVIFLIWFWINLLLNNTVDVNAVSYFKKLSERFESLYQFTPYKMEEAAGWRLKAWQEGIKQLLKNPILGTGFGKILHVDFRGFTSTVEIRGLHNDFLGILIQLGILGFIPFIFINYYTIKYFRKLYKLNNPELIALFAFYIATLVGIFFALYLVTNMLNIFYWITIGLIVSFYKIYAGKNKVSLSK